MQIQGVLPAQAQSGDATKLQPASPLSDEVRSQLFDEFTPRELPHDTAATAQVVWLVVLLATLLASIAVYVIKQVKPHEVPEVADKK